jgi:hypothetical protein
MHGTVQEEFIFPGDEDTELLQNVSDHLPNKNNEMASHKTHIIIKTVSLFCSFE